MLRIILSTLFLAIAVQSLEVELDLPKGTRIFEDQINQTLVQLSKNLSEHDPLTIPLIDVNINNSILNFTLHVEDTILIGFSKFVATELKITVLPPSLKLTILLPKFQLVAPVYDLDLTLLFIPLYGSGSITLLTENVELGVSGKVSITGGGLQGIKDVKVNFDISKSILHISGILNNEPMSQIVSTSTSECFPTFIQNYQAAISNILGPIIESVVNGILTGKSIKDVMPQQGSELIHQKVDGDTTYTTRYYF